MRAGDDEGFSEDDTLEREGLRESTTQRTRFDRRVPDWPFTLGGGFLLAILSMENRLASFGARFALVLPAWGLLAWGMSEVVAKNVTEPRPRRREERLQRRLWTFAALFVAGPFLGMLVRIALD